MENSAPTADGCTVSTDAPANVTTSAKNMKHRISIKIKHCYISNMVYNHVDCEKKYFTKPTPDYLYHIHFWHCKCCGANFLPNGDVIG